MGWASLARFAMVDCGSGAADWLLSLFPYQRLLISFFIVAASGFLVATQQAVIRRRVTGVPTHSREVYSCWTNTSHKGSCQMLSPQLFYQPVERLPMYHEGGLDTRLWESTGAVAVLS